MASDNLRMRTYADVMDGGDPYITLHIDFDRPISIVDFVGVFTSLSSQYDKFIRANHPDLARDAEMYVKEVRDGSLDADLLPWMTWVGVPALITVMDQALIIENFVRNYAGRIGAYLKPGGRDRTANRSDLKDFMGAVEAIAKDSNGSSRIEAVAFEDGEKHVKAAIKFNTPQARIARDEIQKHQIELANTESADYQRVLMKFTQSNIKNISPGRRTGERVIIPNISNKERALIYASDLAEQQIKHEIREADDNVYKKGFIVDVNVQLDENDKAVGYRVTDFHHVIDLNEEEESL